MHARVFDDAKRITLHSQLVASIRKLFSKMVNTIYAPNRILFVFEWYDSGLSIQNKGNLNVLAVTLSSNVRLFNKCIQRKWCFIIILNSGVNQVNKLASHQLLFERKCSSIQRFLEVKLSSTAYSSVILMFGGHLFQYLFHRSVAYSLFLEIVFERNSSSQNHRNIGF